DLRDHYAKFDRKVGVYNSLRFSSRQWRYLDSRLEPQNRLRRPDFLRLVDECGFDLLAEDSHNGNDAHFARVTPAPEFGRYDEADLRIVDMWIAARRRGYAGGAVRPAGAASRASRGSRARTRSRRRRSGSTT